ncbi:MAG: histidinol dehydrogenase [Bacteroidia bacterium]|nr:histidinol dehydrogenase [Bacteroidia bacterium]
MQLVSYPPRETWENLIRRPALAAEVLADRVRPILEAVRQEGDAALRRFTAQFDGVVSDTLEVSAESLADATVSPALYAAMERAAANIRTFHAAQREAETVVETMPGVTCWRRSLPIGRVGLYIPGGSAPLLSTVLMLAIPARLAGCQEIILCTPPGPDGEVPATIRVAARIAGVTRVFRVGGAQAIAGMAYGTASIPKVDKIFGPGNQYVTIAKQLVSQEGVAIDMPAGPSEVAVVADATAPPAFVAADLLAQAEHGPDSQVLLLARDPDLLAVIVAETYRQLETLPRADIARQALANSRAICFDSNETLMDFCNAYAPEHLILAVSNDLALATQVTCAGSVFLGIYSPESVGDYASGTNHTLPTNGYARAYSGVSLDSFVKKVTYQRLTAEGLQALGPTVEILADAESLEAHRQAVRVRLAALAGSAD